mmetsp:Transcript_36761/g.147059  ORF Transcript_36761/g.147059 Transcript_36761/m.147059 type:complete len:135 (-) Transcript_36761:57-461(-)
MCAYGVGFPTPSGNGNFWGSVCHRETELWKTLLQLCRCVWTNSSDPHHPVEEECALMEWYFQHHPEMVTFGGAFVIEKQSFEKRFYSLALSCTNCSDPHHPVEEECALMELDFQRHPEGVTFGGAFVIEKRSFQ